MNMTKLAPWNWFTKEQENEGRMAKFQPGHMSGTYNDPLMRHFDQMFNEFMRGFGTWPTTGQEFFEGGSTWLKPSTDIVAGEKEYTVSVELPGVEEKDVNVEVVGDTLTISAEKHQESEHKDKGCYRMERSYGSFRRVLTLPQDADAEKINARYHNGVMTLTIPRRAIAQRDVKRIEVRAA